MKKPHNILIILTGGTICSFADKAGKRDSDVERGANADRKEIQSLRLPLFLRGMCDI